MREHRSQANLQFAQAQFLVDYLANEACNRKAVNILKISKFVVTVQNKRLKFGMKTSTAMVLNLSACELEY